MARRGMLAGTILLGVLCACQWLEQPRDDAEKRALRRRVEDLEAQLRQCGTPRTAAPSRPASSQSSSLLPAVPASTPQAGDGAAAPGAREAAPATPQPPEPPAGMLPPPRPPAPPTHATVDLSDLGKHVGETLRVTLKDGRTFVGTLKAVESGTLTMERDMGLGTTSFQLTLADVQQVLRRVDAKP